MKFVTIKPSEKQPRVPMPGGYGLPAGAALPADGFSVPRDAFVRRLIADGDAVEVETAAPATPATTKPAAAVAKPTPSNESAS